MAWPKGKPRKPVADAAPGGGTGGEPALREPLKARPTGVGRYKLKAGANWETNDIGPAEGIDRFHIPREDIPEGYDLQWVAVSVMGQDMPRERGSFERTGWTPVHQSDFDGKFDGRWMPKGQDNEINQGGQVLMARPLEISLKARARELRAAQEQVRVKEQALYAGDLPITGADHPSARKFNQVSRSVERIAIPED